MRQEFIRPEQLKHILEIREGGFDPEDKEYFGEQLRAYAGAWNNVLDNAEMTTNFDQYADQIVKTGDEYSAELETMKEGMPEALHDCLVAFNDSIRNVPVDVVWNQHLFDAEQRHDFKGFAFETKQETENALLALSKWQIEALRVLFSLGKNKVIKEEKIGLTQGEKVVSKPGVGFYSMLNRVVLNSAQRIPNFSGGTANLTGRMSGLHGPFKLGNLARTMGYQVILPEPTWDVLFKADLILEKPKTDPGKRELHAVQVKSQVRPGRYDRNVNITDDPILEVGLDDKGLKDWAQINRMCDFLLYGIPQWEAEGVDISPLWATISNANVSVDSFEATASRAFDEGDMKWTRLGLIKEKSRRAYLA